MQYSSSIYFEENVYKQTVCNIAVFTYFDENVYTTVVWDIAVLYISMKMYINDSMEYSSFTYFREKEKYIQRQYGI